MAEPGPPRAAPPHPPTEALSFDDWVVARAPGLVRFATLVTGQSCDAEDVVQDVLIAIYPRWAKLQEAGTTEAYVRRAIVNRNISLWRSFRRRESLTLDASAATQGGWECESPGATPDPGSVLADADIAWRVCEQLPRVQRAAIVLRYYEDQPFAAIAEILDCTESTARSHVRRALATLRGHLEEAAAHD